MKPKSSSRPMKEKRVQARPIVTDLDYDRIRKQINQYRSDLLADPFYRETVVLLESKLEQAEIVDSNEISNDIVTMNSKVKVEDLTTRDHQVYTLVYPEDTHFLQNKISIFSPIGAHLIGSRINEVLHVKQPYQQHHYVIHAIVYQPESSGDFHL